MPKFMTYQRPAPVNKNTWGGKPGQAYGPAPKAKRAAEPAGKPVALPEAPKPLAIKLPDRIKT